MWNRLVQVSVRVCVGERACLCTYDLDDLCQQDSIGDVLAQVLDEALTARFGQVVIGPVCVNLQKQDKQPVSICASVCMTTRKTDRQTDVQ